MTSAEWRVLVAPSREYQSLSARREHHSWLRALARPALIAVVIGTATAVAATGRVTWSLVLSGAACWSFAVLLQIGTAAALICLSGGDPCTPPSSSLAGTPSPRSAPRRLADPQCGARLPRAIDLFFLGHAPWSLWLLAAASVLVSVPAAARHQNVIAITALVPAIWTTAVIFAFCRHVLQLDRRQAAVRTALHQTLTFLMMVFYFGWAVQLWPRIIGSVAS